MTSSFFFDGDDGTRTKIPALSYGKAIIKMYRAVNKNGFLTKDDQKLCRFENLGLDNKLIDYISPLTQSDIDVINESSWPRYAFVNGLLRSGTLQSSHYIDSDQHGRRASLTVLRGDAIWKFDIPCGCRQYENTPMEKLIDLHHPINLRRL